MNMVEPAGCWDGLFSNAIAGDEKFDILNALDFPMESLENDDECIGDWDASKSETLGPIPSDLLISPGPIAVTQKMNANPKQKKLHNNVKEFPRTHIQRHNKLSDVQDSSTFQIQSPVSVLESNGSSSSKILPIKSNTVVPAPTRSKRVRRSNPWFLISTLPAPTKKTSDAKKKIRERMKESTQIETIMKNPSQVSDHKELQNGKKCTHCEITKTPQWREGPMGPKTVCNACGVRYRSGRLFPEYRPAASPSFVQSLHSNSHRKVIEMRSKGKQQQQATRVVEDGLLSNGIAEDEEFDIINALDFPMENPEDDGECIGDWDASKSEFLGPIPSDLLIRPGPVAMTQKINASPKQKPPQNTVKESSRTHIQRHNKCSEIKDSSAFQIQSPVSVLESTVSSSSKTRPIKSNIVVPVRTRPKCGLKPIALNLTLVFPHGPTKKTSNAKEIRGGMKKQTQIETMMKDSLQVSDYKELQNGKKCTHCEITKTPQWRGGPMGPNTLCNACGVRYRSGRLFPEYRPAASPDFIPSLHSNSHRKVIQMRSKGKQQQQHQQANGVVEEEEAAPMLPQLEIVPVSSYLFDFV